LEGAVLVHIERQILDGIIAVVAEDHTNGDLIILADIRGFAGCYLVV
jgi:hypothetical protein